MNGQGQADPLRGQGAEAGAPEWTAPSVGERSLSVALLLTATGGFLDAFTYVGHGKVFANTMTANVVFLAIFVACAQWVSAVHLLPTILAFMLGVFLAYRARHPVFLGPIRRPALLCLIVELVFLAVVSVLPKSFPSVVLVPAIALVAAIQNSIFTNVEAWVYNSVMTTGNLRRFAESLYSGAFYRRDPKALREARVFGAICFCFAFGAGVGALATNHSHNRALWLPVAALTVASYLCWKPRESKQ